MVSATNEVGVASGSRVTITERQRGTILAVVASPDMLAQRDWPDAVLESIDFL